MAEGGRSVPARSGVAEAGAMARSRGSSFWASFLLILRFAFFAFLPKMATPSRPHWCRLRCLGPLSGPVRGPLHAGAARLARPPRGPARDASGRSAAAGGTRGLVTGDLGRQRLDLLFLGERLAALQGAHLVTGHEPVADGDLVGLGPGERGRVQLRGWGGRGPHAPR